jgi:DNA-binding NtrC family response regulator
MSEILVVDDEPGIRTLVQEILEEEGYEVRLAENGETARKAMQDKAPDLVLLDIWMPDLDGISLLKEWVSSGQANMPVVMMSGHGTIHTAVEATRLGAFDFLEKPVPYKRLLETVERALRQTRKPPSLPDAMPELGASEAVRQLVQKLKHAAGIGAPILLSCEAGAGAEACARFLHLPKTPLVEVKDLSRLSDAPQQLLVEAKGGVLFVPEVGGLTPFQQRGLEMILARHQDYDVRVVCASSVNLAEKAAQGSYSRDLYNTLARVAVRVPPLREHPEDIAMLVRQILDQEAARSGQAPAVFSDEALQALTAHDWPGNLDELRNVVSSLALASHGAPIEARDVHALLGLPERNQPTAMGIRLDIPLKEARDAFERVYLNALLQECGWAVSKAAARAGMERTAFYRKLKSLGIELPTRGND